LAKMGRKSRTVTTKIGREIVYNFLSMRKLAISISLILLPVLLIFKNLFVPGPLAAGDAPHFFFEELKDLSFEPTAWTARGHNLGGINQPLWLHPVMILYRYLGQLLGNDLTIRILFYLPAIILAGLGPFLLTRYLKFSGKIQFFSSLFYLLNTYFLLLIDGGQVGVALAYGFFPVTLLFLIKNKFWPALTITFLLTVADPRIAVICFLTALLWNLNSKNLKFYILLVVTLVGLTAYWWFPLAKIRQAVSLGMPDLTLVRLRHAITIFSPHWPGNIFGKVANPPWYFYGVSVLILGNLVWTKKRKLVILFLVFAFLATIPLGSAFRDSTKFFVPLVLLGGILIGQTVEKFKKSWATALVYVYLIFLVHPALLGNLNFVLSGNKYSGDFQKIYENSKTDNSFFRTAWFPSVHPLTFETESTPALDAKDLVNLRPLAAVNAGSSDNFNYIHRDNFLDWYDLLGIKYLVFSGDPRNPYPNEEERQSWDDLLALTATTSGLVRQDWITDISVYENPDTLPRIFSTDQLNVVIGPELATNYQLLTTVYVEDGKWDPHTLEGTASESASLVFNGKNETDLAMSFLQDYFVGPADAGKNQWAVYGPEEYLTYKYQLLIRDYVFNDFDYNRGIAFSTQEGEKITFEFKVPETGNYVVAARRAGPDGDFGWETSQKTLKKGRHKEVIASNGKLSIFNVIALIPKTEFDKAIALAKTFNLHFGSVSDDETRDFVWEQVEVEKTSPTRYLVNFPENARWIVFTDSYHPGWAMTKDRLEYPSLPAYSMVNVFYRRPGWVTAEMVFAGQDQVRWGIWVSTVSILTLAIIWLWKRK